jgi:MFS family permease
MSRINAIWQLYTITGLVLSLGMTGSFAPMLTTTARWFVKRRGLMTGIVLAGAGVGQIVMSPLASIFILNYGWRTSYVIIAVTTLILVIIAAQFIRRDPTKMGLLPYGANEEELKRQEIEQIGFTFQEAIRSPKFWMICVIFIGYMFGQTMVMMHSVAYATDLGYSLIMGANVLVIIGITSVIGKLVMGSAGDRIGNKLVLIITFGMVVIALIWLIIAKNIWQLYLFAAIYGFAYGGLVTQFSPLVAKIFGLASHGVIFGAVTASGVIVGSLGPLLAGYIFDVVGSYQVAFIISAVVSSIALLLILLLKPVSRFNEALRQ